MTAQYTLAFLANQFAGKDAAKCDVSEFRLLCSGTVYSGKVETADWRRSDITRVLLNGACKLQVTSRPLDDYPQELVLLLPVPMVTEERVSKVFPGAQASMMFRPDDIIARDLASLLTLLWRRLVTVYAQVHVISPSAPELWRDIALPLANSLSGTAWKRRPMALVYYWDKVEVNDHNPPPKAIDADELDSLLRNLPQLPNAEAFLLSTRLYSEPLEIIEARPEIAYLLLVACAETIASAELDGWEPDEAEKIKSRGEVVAEACRLRLNSRMPISWP